MVSVAAGVLVDVTTLALDLINVGFHVFPVDPATKHPLTLHGHLDATDDPEVVATWFSLDYPDAKVGVHTGASGLCVLDVDNKDNKNGFVSIEDGWLDVPETFEYDTPNNGRHYLYTAPTGKHLAPAAGYRGLTGVDRRAGSSYIVFHGPVAPGSRGELVPAPGWLVDEAPERTGAAFDGELDVWLGGLDAGEPNSRVLKAIESVLGKDFSHSVMVERQMNLIRLAAEGAVGVRAGIDLLRDSWVHRNPALHSTPESEWAFKFDEALLGGIAKFGAEDERIKALPPYSKCLSEVPEGFDVTNLTGAQRPKRHFFDVLRAIANSPMSAESVASLLWGAPAVRGHARDWGIDYVYAKIAEVRDGLNKNSVDGVDAASVDSPETVVPDFVLLSDYERAYVELTPSYIDHYCSFAASRVSMMNYPYHRANAWTILSLVFSFKGFIMENEGIMGVNLWMVPLGKSSTGKSRAIKIRDGILAFLFADDQTYDIGYNASPEALHEALLKRDRKTSFFNGDEAASFFSDLTGKDWLRSMEAFLARLYEGLVPPQVRRGKEYGTALTSFVMCMFGTPERVTELLSKDMFHTGFLPRISWFVGEPPVDSPERHVMSRPTGPRTATDVDFGSKGMADELFAARDALGAKSGRMVESKDALDRMARAAADMEAQARKSGDWSLLESSVKRLSHETVPKMAALLAMSEGTRDVGLRHVLHAVKQAEELAGNLIWVASSITDSVFSRQCNEVEAFVLSKGGVVSKAVLFRRFKQYEPREMLAMLSALESQSRVVEAGSGYEAR